jgi:energy-coupling factor transporter ATP-binding protein EcfA2
LVGPNGVGKSVLLAAAAGVLSLNQIRIEWAPHRGCAPLMASQYPELEIFEDLVGDEVSYAAVSRGFARSDTRSSASRMFDLLELGGEFLERRTWSLSGGEKRLLSLVSALVAPASLLILDEPTAGLDPSRSRILAGMVAEAASRGAVLVASQDRAWLDSLPARRFSLGPGGP